MACHGVLPQEKSEPQPFLVDAQLYLDLRAAAASDDLDRGVDYSQVYQFYRSSGTGQHL
ncbi:MAG: dihydroneopterin aldolase [Syntrophothermaceae bacterium]